MKKSNKFSLRNKLWLVCLAIFGFSLSLFVGINFVNSKSTFMSDGMIFLVQNQPRVLQPISSRDRHLERAIQEEIPFIGEFEYLYNRIDLNGDGQPETIVHLIGPTTCGTGGCTTQIFQGSGSNYNPVGYGLLSHPPIIVTNQTHSGWKDIVVHQRDATPVRFRFIGEGYESQTSQQINLNRITGTWLFAREYRRYLREPFRVP
ncbi:hypothetical protein NEA10_14820 [Phormidium yuhuli AB48]|uniref:Uncharacterized protein n=1 Tax=Phormidium yuhuli AB48 TaxID=2940671 RepID=A0ABY5AMV3_9CYAN|nr:hypothetical protein [Phormidium yuhuli]USR90111.1 hypothetical protein NEA10_14820 [Phormidium yuhuli AB48]